jgi:hypothetical protein
MTAQARKSLDAIEAELSKIAEREGAIPDPRQMNFFPDITGDSDAA